MEKLKTILTWLKSLPPWLKSLAVVSIALATAVVLFSSCSTMTATLPNITKNEIGVEGVVSKEATTTKTTKWYFKPDEN